eukprot:2284709-Rhodomonas_salina.3
MSEALALRASNAAANPGTDTAYAATRLVLCSLLLRLDLEVSRSAIPYLPSLSLFTTDPAVALYPILASSPLT